MQNISAQKTHNLKLSLCIYLLNIKYFRSKKQDYQMHRPELRLCEPTQIVHMTTILQ